MNVRQHSAEIIELEDTSRRLRKLQPLRISLNTYSWGLIREQSLVIGPDYTRWRNVIQTVTSDEGGSQDVNKVCVQDNEVQTSSRGRDPVGTNGLSEQRDHGRFP